MSATINVEVLADVKALRRGMDQSVESLSKLNKTAKSMSPTLKRIPWC